MKANKIKFLFLFWDVVSSLCCWGMNVSSLLRGTECKLSNWFNTICAFMTSSSYKSRRNIWQWGGSCPKCFYLCCAQMSWFLCCSQDLNTHGLPMDPIYRRKTASNFYSKRNGLKSETLIKKFSSGKSVVCQMSLVFKSEFKGHRGYFLWVRPIS